MTTGNATPAASSVSLTVRAVAADRGALYGFPRPGAELVGYERGGIHVAPGDHRNAPHRVRAAQQLVPGTAVLACEAKRLGHQGDRFGRLRVGWVAVRHLARADDYRCARIRGHGRCDPIQRFIVTMST
jgi:hypothetical protein